MSPTHRQCSQTPSADPRRRQTIQRRKRSHKTQTQNRRATRFEDRHRQGSARCGGSGWELVNPATVRTRQRRAGLLAFSSSCELTRHGSDVASRRRSTRCNGCASGTRGAAEARQILSIRFVDESVRTLLRGTPLTAFLRKGFRCCRCVDTHCVSKHQGIMSAHCAKRWSAHRSHECGIAEIPPFTHARLQVPGADIG